MSEVKAEVLQWSSVGRSRLAGSDGYARVAGCGGREMGEKRAVTDSKTEYCARETREITNPKLQIPKPIPDGRLADGLASRGGGFRKSREGRKTGHDRF
jgi:hypothetical protein